MCAHAATSAAPEAWRGVGKQGFCDTILCGGAGGGRAERRAFLEEQKTLLTLIVWLREQGGAEI